MILTHRRNTAPHFIWSLLITITLFNVSAFAEEAHYPNYANYVNDYANLLSPQTEARLNNFIGELGRKTTAQVAVLTVESIAPETVEGYAVKLFEKWGIGQRGKDNGVLLLVAVRDKKTRIEVGYGLEGAIPDAKAYAIYKSILVPHFRKGDFETGISEATQVVVGLIAKEYNVDISELAEVPGSIRDAKVPSKAGNIVRILFFLIIFVLIFGLRLGLFGFFLLGPGRTRRGGYWYGSGIGGMGGGFGGGFGGFGGGMSGGGGAGGGW